MPILPLIDLMIFLGWTCLSVGAVLKAVYVTTSYRPTILSFSPVDFMWIAAMFLLLSLALSARTWVKLNEPQIAAQRREAMSREAHARAEAAMARNEEVRARAQQPLPPREAETA